MTTAWLWEAELILLGSIPIECDCPPLGLMNPFSTLLLWAKLCILNVSILEDLL